LPATLSVEFIATGVFCSLRIFSTLTVVRIVSAVCLNQVGIGMEFFETVGVIVLATAFQLPFHLILASPVLLLAWLLSKIFRLDENRWSRRALLTGVIALGIAPLYGFHLSMVPVYWGLISGYASPLQLITSVAITWLVVFVIAAVWDWGRKVKEQLPNTSLHTDSKPDQ
jgi:hypothetical protein